MALGDRTVTVFGGGGFIGRHLVRRLGRSGAVVRVPSRHVSRLAVLRTAGVVGQIVPEIIDNFDDVEIEAAIKGSDAVVNLVGTLTPNKHDSFDRLHAELPARIARIAAACGVKKLIHISALGAGADAISAYGKSKAAGEEAVRAAYPAATIFRPSIVFGPEDKFFNKFAALALMTPVLPLIGGGANRIQPVYVGDVADAIQAALTRPDSAGRTYELGGPQAYSFRQLLELTVAAIGRERFYVSLPWGVAEFKASILERLPGKLLTRDQVAMLKQDNVLSGKAPGLDDLGITPTGLELILPTFLDRFCKGGRFSEAKRT